MTQQSNNSRAKQRSVDVPDDVINRIKFIIGDSADRQTAATKLGISRGILNRILKQPHTCSGETLATLQEKTK